TTSMPFSSLYDVLAISTLFPYTTLFRSATLMNFKGFEGKYILSKVTGLSRLKYDRSKPFTKPVHHYDTYNPVKTINIPEAYLIPDRKSTRLNSSHVKISYAVFCLKNKKA